MYPEKSKFFKHIDFVILDLLCMEVSFVVAYFIRHRSFSLFNDSAYRSVLVILVIANIITCYIFESMRDVLKKSRQLEFYSTVKQVIFTTAILIAYIFLTKISDDISRNTIILFPFIYLFTSYVLRLAYRYILIIRLKKRPSRNVVIISNEKNAIRLIKKFGSSVSDINIKFIIMII